MGLFKRDKKEEFPLFCTKDHSDEVLDVLEALASATSSPLGLARMVATRNNAILDLSGLMRHIATAIAVKGLQCSDQSTRDPTTGDITTAYVGIQSSNIGAAPPSLFTSDIYKLAVSGSGVVYVKCHFDITTSATSPTVTITHASSTPANDDAGGNYYVQLCTYSVGAQIITLGGNSAYGPIAIEACAVAYSNPVNWHFTLIPSS